MINTRIKHVIDRCVTNSTGCIAHTNLQFPNRRQGKVRDTYTNGDKLIIVSTDRQSAFDRQLACVPFKGQVLNLCSTWWMDKTRHIVPNALLHVPDPNIAVMQRCNVFPVEVIVRGYVTGSTSTSLWTAYAKGDREYCGHVIPDGLKKNERLPCGPIVTPTTKSDIRDVPISGAEIVCEGLMTRKEWDEVERAALRLFAYGQETAAERGLILVDTKYEFGVNPKTGQIMLVDEIHTPDSSRYWIRESYMDCFASEREPESIDKEFLRLWYKAHCDPYNDPVLPDAPLALVAELAARYVHLYERITGSNFQLPDLHMDPDVRMHHALCNKNDILDWT